MICKYWINVQNMVLKNLYIISNNANIPELNMQFNNASVELVDNHKHLGVTFASDGKWTVHIDNLATSTLKQTNVLPIY